MLVLAHWDYPCPCSHRSPHLIRTRKGKTQLGSEVDWERVSLRGQQGTAAEGPTFLMTGSRLGPDGAELGGGIQDPSHILIGLGACLGRRVGGLEPRWAWGREVQPKTQDI